MSKALKLEFRTVGGERKVLTFNNPEDQSQEDINGIFGLLCNGNIFKTKTGDLSTALKAYVLSTEKEVLYPTV